MIWLTMLLACVPPAASSPAPSLVGKWEPVDPDARLCLLLTAEGGATLSIRGWGKEPKVEVTATYALDRDRLTLLPSRIYRDRYVSPCRKHVESGRMLETLAVLGQTLAPAQPSVFTVRPVPPDRLEVCGAPGECALLARADAPE